MKKYYKVKLTVLVENVDKNDVLDRIDEDIIVEKLHGSFCEIQTNKVFDIVWLEKNNQLNHYSDNKYMGREFIPLTGRDIIDYYDDSSSLFDNDYHSLYHNYYAIDDIFNDIEENGYYALIEPIYFNKNNPRATKEEVREYLSDNNKDIFNYLNNDISKKSNQQSYKLK